MKLLISHFWDMFSTIQPFHNRRQIRISDQLHATAHLALNNWELFQHNKAECPWEEESFIIHYIDTEINKYLTLWKASFWWWIQCHWKYLNASVVFVFCERTKKKPKPQKNNMVVNWRHWEGLKLLLCFQVGMLKMLYTTFWGMWI